MSEFMKAKGVEATLLIYNFYFLPVGTPGAHFSSQESIQCGFPLLSFLHVAVKI